MIFAECELGGVLIIDLERLDDSRGFFARAWCEREFVAHGLTHKVAQVNIGFSRAKGTLRGMHYQEAPYEEVKLVRCTRGAVYDVIVDLRPNSPTYKQWFGVELTADNHRMLYVPRGLAHGYETTEDNTEICYHTSEFYLRESARGVRYNDPVFGIEWPLEPSLISEADLSWPDYIQQQNNGGNIA